MSNVQESSLETQSTPPMHRLISPLTGKGSATYMNLSEMMLSQDSSDSSAKRTSPFPPNRDTLRLGRRNAIERQLKKRTAPRQVCSFSRSHREDAPDNAQYIPKYIKEGS